MMMMLSSRLLVRGHQGGDRDNDFTNLWVAFRETWPGMLVGYGYEGVDKAHRIT